MDSEMAGDWIKLEHSTPDKPEVFRIAETLSIAPEHALGCLIRVWMWADQQIGKGNAADVTETSLDRIARVDGFGAAMSNAGWLTTTTTGVQFPNFDRHNGQTAKTRGLTAKRVAKCKAGKCNAAVTIDALPREEKRREEQEPPVAPQGAKENGYCQSFIEWWDHYPRKVGKDAAYRAWRKAGGKLKTQMVCSSQEAAAYLLKQVAAYSDARRGKDQQFTPNPATWLNQGRWADDPATWLIDGSGDKKKDAGQSDPVRVPTVDSPEVQALYGTAPDWRTLQ